MNRSAASPDDLGRVIARHWGFPGLRPLQEQAMRAVLGGRDSLVVLPTGGGKSLCYQAPAILQGGTTVVVSPLIALMKDQVDGLRTCEVPAAQLDSSLSGAERSAVLQELRDGSLRLLFVSPERLALPDFRRLLADCGVRTFAIDEAHCISHWGHDFRPEYRQLACLRDEFPQASVHAYTATATERVRRDIIEQLRLRDPEVLVGNFDRPNLTYRVLPRHSELKQVRDVLERHPGEGGIIYCISRREVDELAAELRALGIKAQAYHAGLSADQRKQTQDEFLAETCDVVVATVAFGMGIDRSNLRFVLHARMPKSLEHYQQETGRAGRDGLEAECVLLYSGADTRQWRSIMERSAAESGADPSYLAGSLAHLDHMDRYCRGAVCRHKALVAYFGQDYEGESCGACDLCLGDTEEVPDATVVAQKILSCVARVGQRFGIGHVAAVLRGENSETVRKRGHERLSTYGLLQEHSAAAVRDWVYQLIGQGALLQEGDEYPILKLNEASWEVMRGQRAVRLVQLVRRKKGQRVRAARAEGVSWEGVDRELFEVLRCLRRDLAARRGVPPYVVFNDATLRELARVRPATAAVMLGITGVGESKLRDYGEDFLRVLEEECARRGLPRTGTQAQALPRPTAVPVNVQALFRAGQTVEEVVRETGWPRETVVDALVRFVAAQRPASIGAWVADGVARRIVAAARQLGSAQPRAVAVALGGGVSLDDVRVVLAHLQVRSPHGGSDETPAG